MIEVDARGLSCPIPVVKARKAIDENLGVEIIVLVDNEVARENITRLAGSRGYSVVSKAVSDGYNLQLKPGK